MGRPSILRTKELPEETPYKGGVTMCREMFRDARRLLADTNARVTTLIDYYGLPADFRWLAEVQRVTARQGSRYGIPGGVARRYEASAVPSFSRVART